MTKKKEVRQHVQGRVSQMSYDKLHEEIIEVEKHTDMKNASVALDRLIKKAIAFDGQRAAAEAT